MSEVPPPVPIEDLTADQIARRIEVLRSPAYKGLSSLHREYLAELEVEATRKKHVRPKPA